MALLGELNDKRNHMSLSFYELFNTKRNKILRQYEKQLHPIGEGLCFEQHFADLRIKEINFLQTTGEEQNQN